MSFSGLKIEGCAISPQKSLSVAIREYQLKIIFIIRHLFNNNERIVGQGKTNGTFIRHGYLPANFMLDYNT
jgi:hypothetical protein